jgi:hypothetical protein
MHEIRARFVSENEDLLACCPQSCTMAGGAVLSLSLVFARCAEQMQDASPSTSRLWVHNESANVNEECIVFSWR